MFNYYRVLFPTIANAAAANSMQIAEVELLCHREITSPNDAVNLTVSHDNVALWGVGGVFDRQFDAPTNNLEIWGWQYDGTIVDITPAAGATVLKGFEFIGAPQLNHPNHLPGYIEVEEFVQ